MKKQLRFKWSCDWKCMKSQQLRMGNYVTDEGNSKIYSSATSFYKNF